ncbi:glycoside hydrolase family 19 [Bisgaard Taxon 10/6]|uniref:glycoside hydrolase family 19 n=1 Tax=Exercitatus varius TaxID=67857 RepID=UPI00294B2E38|nr:glycoside hydrolase family 19 [Exercitatus varius]MDG2961357.1 glycoside hydrolase family 19 [Exercitatus varius]
MQEEAVKGIPLLAKNNLETQTDTEVKLPKPIAVKAGEELGLMGEYNQADEQDKKLLHLEVFTYDNIDAFRTKAKAAYEEDKKREKGKRVLQDNFLYVNRNSPTYAIAENQVTPLGTTSTEVMVPLSEVEKKTVKEGEKSRNYYNIQPYLHHGTKSKTGIYVDDSHVTHGITFLGINVFGQESNSLCLFDAALHDYLNPNSGLTIEEKNKLDPLFKAIMDELDLEANKGAPIQFEAGRLRDILLDPIQQRRLTGIIVKHDNEWKTTRQLDFEPVCNVYRENGKEEKANRLTKRVDDLSIGLKVEQFDTDKQAYFIHPLGLIGALMPYSTCFCHRDFTVEEFKKIVEGLRKSEGLTNAEIWKSTKKGGATPTDRTYETAVKELNRVMNKYEINTCIRKIHFLAQVYHETDRFNSTQEYDSVYTPKYDPFRGRGLIHLTNPNNYKKFANAMNDNLINVTPSIVATNIKYAFESRGWFWTYGSVWGNLNLKADVDDIYWLNIGVNGGFYGFGERIKYVKKLIELFNIKNCQNLSLNKPLGKYKLSISSIKNTNYGKSKKSEFEKYDE